VLASLAELELELGRERRAASKAARKAPHRGGLLLRAIPARGRLPRRLLLRHDSILVSKVKSLHISQGDSQLPKGRRRKQACERICERSVAQRPDGLQRGVMGSPDTTSVQVRVTLGFPHSRLIFPVFCRSAIHQARGKYPTLAVEWF
jgi:hypothetical protein